ncbi:hypothetical protein FQN55_009613 [Onygenales sp. PD_40]|nr:hypothetical protein FQN55_009613 [Onygenales sp. PD_40]KAK2784951.1 hypothetical protein FQN53_008137 [Emmonsiellopsis sp. PD_33]KAK2805874.1 hypothetical protein FQN51_008648 [Onygenales sp. PD_10]
MGSGSPYGEQLVPAPRYPNDGLERNAEAEGLQVAPSMQPEHQHWSVEKPQPPPPAHTILGMRKKTFWLAFAIAAFLVIAAGVGGGLGGYFGGKNRATSAPVSTDPASNAPVSTGTGSPSSVSQSATPSTTSTGKPSYQTSGTTGTSQNPCPGANQTEIHADRGNVFKVHCQTDWKSGKLAADGKSNVRDIAVRNAYTIEECVDECVKFNNVFPGACMALTYESDLSRVYSTEKGNCFLKDRVGQYIEGWGTTISARLVVDE